MKVLDKALLWIMVLIALASITPLIPPCVTPLPANNYFIAADAHYLDAYDHARGCPGWPGSHF